MAFFVSCQLSTSLHICISIHAQQVVFVINTRLFEVGMFFAWLWQNLKCHNFKLCHDVSFRCDVSYFFTVTRTFKFEIKSNSALLIMDLRHAKGLRTHITHKDKMQDKSIHKMTNIFFMYIMN
jgi:hypothetical protein